MGLDVLEQSRQFGLAVIGGEVQAAGRGVVARQIGLKLAIVEQLDVGRDPLVAPVLLPAPVPAGPSRYT